MKGESSKDMTLKYSLLSAIDIKTTSSLKKMIYYSHLGGVDGGGAVRLAVGGEGLQTWLIGSS